MPSDPIGEIPIQITGDYSSLQSDLQAAESLAAKGGAEIASAFTQAAGGLNLDLAGSIKGLTDVGEAANKQIPFLEEFGGTITNWLQHPMQMAQIAVGEMLVALGPVGIVAAAAATAVVGLGTAIGSLVLEQGAAAEKMSNFAAQLNLSFNQARLLSDMADIAGVSVAALARVSMQLATALEDPAGAGKKVATALNEMGISANDSGEALLQLLQKLSEIPDATDRIAAAHAVMGRSATQLEPLLRDYTALKEAVTALGGELSKEAVDKLMAADDAAGKLSIAWRNLKDSFATTFSGPTTGFLDFISTILNPDSYKFLAAGTGGVATAVSSVTTAVKGLTDAQHEAIVRSAEYNAELDKANLAHDKNVLAASEHKKALEKLREEGVKKLSEAFGVLGLKGVDGKTKIEAMEDALKLIDKQFLAGKIPLSKYTEAHEALNAEVKKNKIDALKTSISNLNAKYASGEIPLQRFASESKKLNDQMALLVPKTVNLEKELLKLFDGMEDINAEMKTYSQRTSAAAIDTFDMTKALEGLDAPIYDYSVALGDIGVKSTETMNKIAADAQRTYDAIANDPRATQWEKDNAMLRLLKAQADAMRANSISIPADMEQTMQDLEDKVSGHTPKIIGYFDDLSKDIGAVFANFGGDAVRALFSGEGSLGDRFKKLFQNIAADMLDVFLKPVEKMIEDFIAGAIADLLGGKGLGGVLDRIKDIGKASGGDIFPNAGGVTGSGEGDIEGTGLPGGTIEGPDMGSGEGGIPGVGGGGGAGSAVGQAAGGGILAIVNMIANVVSAISNVIQNFQLFAVNKSLDLIVAHTLATQNDLANIRRDEWDRHNEIIARTGSMWQTLLNTYDFLGANLPGILEATRNLYTLEVDRLGTQQLSMARGNFEANSKTHKSDDYDLLHLSVDLEQLFREYVKDPLHRIYEVLQFGPDMKDATLGTSQTGLVGQKADVIVNAVDPTARGVTKALVEGLNELGIKVR